MAQVHFLAKLRLERVQITGALPKLAGGAVLTGEPIPARKGIGLASTTIYASGLGLVTRPLFTAKTPEGQMLMLAPRLAADQAYDLSAWRVRGMRATATGAIDFTGMKVTAADLIGAPDDYYRSPTFKGGAWRFAAVQRGAASRLAVLMREELRARRRTDDPHQKARVGTAALAAETARLWVARAAAIAEDPSSDPSAADAYVNLARLAVESSALEVITLGERGLGLSASAPASTACHRRAIQSGRARLSASVVQIRLCSSPGSMATAPSIQAVLQPGQHGHGPLHGGAAGRSGVGLGGGKVDAEHLDPVVAADAAGDIGGVVAAVIGQHHHADMLERQRLAGRPPSGLLQRFAVRAQGIVLGVGDGGGRQAVQVAATRLTRGSAPSAALLT